MEVDESDGEDQGVVFPMDTHVVDLNWTMGRQKTVSIGLALVHFNV